MQASRRPIRSPHTHHHPTQRHQRRGIHQGATTGASRTLGRGSARASEHMGDHSPTRTHIRGKASWSQAMAKLEDRLCSAIVELTETGLIVTPRTMTQTRSSSLLPRCHRGEIATDEDCALRQPSSELPVTHGAAKRWISLKGRSRERERLHYCSEDI